MCSSEAQNPNNNNELQESILLNNDLVTKNYYENNITISEIEKEEKEPLKIENTKYLENEADISLSSLLLDNEGLNLKKNSIKFNKKKRISKNDLNNIPLPIFSCIYCSNDFLSFRHLSNEIIYSKYYIQTSIYDMQLLDSLINKGTSPFMKKNCNFNIKNIIWKNTEYLNKFLPLDETYTFLKSKAIKSMENQNKSYVYLRKKVYNNINSKKNNKTKPTLSDDFNKLKSFFQYNKNYNTTFQLTNTLSTTNNKLTFSSNIINHNMNSRKLNINIKGDNLDNLYFNKENNKYDILLNFNKETKNSKLNIIYEDKPYDIWNPEISSICETEKDNNEIKEEKKIDGYKKFWAKNHLP